MDLIFVFLIFTGTTFLAYRILSRGEVNRERLERVTGSDRLAPAVKYSLSVNVILGSKRSVRTLPLPVSIIFFLTIFVLTRNVVPSFLWAISAYMITYLLLSFLRQRHIRRINEQLIDVVNSLIGSVKAGLSLPQALQIVARDTGGSLGKDFYGVVNRIQLGASVEEALRWLASRAPDTEMHLVVSVLLVYQDMGGDLSRMLEKAGNTLRERVKLRREVKRLTAQTRLSAMIGIAIPFVLAFFLYNMNPQFLVPLYTTRIGIIALSVGLALSVTGIVLIFKIIRSVEL